jgi:hypothetical protein
MMPCVRFRQRQVVGRAPFREHADVLLGVERVAARPFEQGELCLARKQRPLGQCRDQPGGLVRGQRRERECGGVELASSPRRSALEQLQPRGADDEQRDAADPVDEMLDEVQQPLVGPLHVLEDEHERALLREGLEEASPRRERFLARAAVERGRLADERAQV